MSSAPYEVRPLSKVNDDIVTGVNPRLTTVTGREI